LLLLATARAETPLTVQNGWYVHGDRVIWGYAQHNGWWRAGQRPNLARNAPGQIGPNRTEDLDRLTDAMLRYGYPGFEHNYGLWYDRRRDRHDTARRNDPHVVPPFLEQPWARGHQGRAWDGLPKYDLTRYNAWYFDRLKQFADLCDRKGVILFHDFYMQHALLEQQAHYVDFPWRPANCLQKTDLPDHVPAANAFYDISHPVRRKLHRAYIRKCLDVLGRNTHVVFLCGEEYTGPLSFMRFWLDTLREWEAETGRRVHIGLSATKDVEDAILGDPKYAAAIDTVDLRYWWYRPDGTVFAPRGGREIPGRYTGAFDPRWLAATRAQTRFYTDRGMGRMDTTTTPQVYRQIRECRDRHPRKAILHQLPVNRRQAWAMLMAGGSMFIGQMPYPHKADPPDYISPEICRVIRPTYEFIRQQLATTLPRMTPRNLLTRADSLTWCLADPGHAYLVYSSNGARFTLDLSAAAGRLAARWFDPRTGALTPAHGGAVAGGHPVTFTPPSGEDWALWLRQEAPTHP
jgi:hypothetical protein